MKHALALLAILASVATAEAAPRHARYAYPPPQLNTPTSPYSENIFGPNRSGIARPTAVSEGRSTYRSAPRGASTGGVND